MSCSTTVTRAGQAAAARELDRLAAILDTARNAYYAATGRGDPAAFRRAGAEYGRVDAMCHEAVMKLRRAGF